MFKAKPGICFFYAFALHFLLKISNFVSAAKTHPLVFLSGFLLSPASEGRASAQERLTLGGEDLPLRNCGCSCQGVANKHQIYVHFERSTFTIGFLSGAVARERAPPRGSSLGTGSWQPGAGRTPWRALGGTARSRPSGRRCPPDLLPEARHRHSPPATGSLCCRPEDRGASACNFPAAALRRGERVGASCRTRWSSPLASELSELAELPPGFPAPRSLRARCSPDCCPPLCQGAQAPELPSRVYLGTEEGCPQPRRTVFSPLTHLFLHGVSSTNPNPGLPGEKQDWSSV